MQWFARMQGLTAAETRVLERLCVGLHPRQICLEQGVGLSTIRTHIRAIRSKTGADGIRAVVEQIAKLPPMVGLVRNTNPISTMPAWRAIESLQATLLRVQMRLVDDDEIDSKTVGELARAAKDLASAMKSSVDVEIRVRDRAARGPEAAPAAVRCEGRTRTVGRQQEQAHRRIV